MIYPEQPKEDNHTAGKQADNADVSMTMNRDTLIGIILGKTKLNDAAGSGGVKLTDSKANLEQFVSYLESFDFWSNIVTPRLA